MPRPLFSVAVLLAFAAVSAGAPIDNAVAGPKDKHGDSLPKGAVARLGSVRSELLSQFALKSSAVAAK